MNNRDANEQIKNPSVKRKSTSRGYLSTKAKEQIHPKKEEEKNTKMSKKNTKRPKVADLYAKKKRKKMLTR